MGPCLGEADRLLVDLGERGRVEGQGLRRGAPGGAGKACSVLLCGRAGEFYRVWGASAIEVLGRGRLAFSPLLCGFPATSGACFGWFLSTILFQYIQIRQSPSPVLAMGPWALAVGFRRPSLSRWRSRDRSPSGVPLPHLTTTECSFGLRTLYSVIRGNRKPSSVPTSTLPPPDVSTRQESATKVVVTLAQGKTVHFPM